MPNATNECSSSFASKMRCHPLTTLRQEMDDALSRVVGAGESWIVGYLEPLADISETDLTIDLSMDIPGVDPNDVDIRLTRDTVTVRGERKSGPAEKGRRYHRVERRRGGFSRSFRLPCAVMEKEIIAECRDGVLTIKLPKSEAVQSHKIAVRHI